MRLGLGAGAGFQRPGKKFVEAFVAGDIRIGRLVHIDAVAADKPADDRGREVPRLSTGQLAGEDGQGLFGQEILG